MSKNRTVRLTFVSIRSSNNSLQLYFSYKGKRYCRGLGLKDTPTNEAIAVLKARQIERDIAFNEFDESLEKYINPESKSNDKKNALKELNRASLDKLWDYYLKSRESVCSSTTMSKQYRTFTGYIKRLPIKDLNKSNEILQWVSENLPADNGRRFIVRLNACCKLAVQHGKLDKNPFEGKSRDMAFKRGRPKPEPFSAKERDAILEAIKTDRFNPSNSRFKHSFYWPYTWFCFYTGARPSEVCALSWRDIHIEDSPEDADHYGWINFENAIVFEGNGSRTLKTGLKTEDRRAFPINSQMYEFLKELKSEGNSLVFPGIKGGFINPSNFGDRVWKPVLKGLGLRVRKPYCTRHTFITLALQAKAHIPDLARVVGNSPETLLKNYSGFLKEFKVPTL